MDFMQVNKNVMDNTLELCNSLEFLKKSIEDSIKKEYIIYQEEKLGLLPLTANEGMKIIVSKERTFEAAEKYKGKKI